MLIQFEHDARPISIDSTQFHDISIPIVKNNQVNCYYLDQAQFSYFESDAFSGSLDRGGSVNCEKISLYPHASGTHTECALHVFQTDFDIRHIVFPPFLMGRLLTVEPAQIGEDRVINIACLGRLQNEKKYRTLLIRTGPNMPEKMHANYSGKNPVYFDPETLSLFKELGFTHLICDLPSIDKENDEGALKGHKIWFTEAGQVSRTRTITELVYIADTIPDGDYAVSFELPRIETDAVPSGIKLYPCL